MEYAGKSFSGMRALSLEMQQTRVFNVGRILELQAVDTDAPSNE